MTLLYGAILVVLLLAYSVYQETRPQISMTNVDNQYYLIFVDTNEKTEPFPLPAQHLPRAIEMLESLMDQGARNIEMRYISYNDPSVRMTLLLPDWAPPKLLRLLRKHRRSWSPNHVFSEPSGPYR